MVYDKGPGPDGIPGCIGDNIFTNNGSASCDQKLGQGAPGAKTDPNFATGRDDRAIMRPMGNTTMPAVGAKFKWRPASPATEAHFGLGQSPPTVNSAAAFTIRDLHVIIDRSADVLVKVNTTQCPLTATGPACESCKLLGGDTDGDGICDANDNCPTVANPGQQDGGGGLEAPADGVGDACDNCVNVNNPRVTPSAASYLASNPWRTLTGGQIDDDHDGYGNKCDGKFVGTPNQNVGGLDLRQFRTSQNENRTGDTCGTVGGSRPCAIYDLDENAAGDTIGGLHLWSPAAAQQRVAGSALRSLHGYGLGPAALHGGHRRLLHGTVR